MGLLVFLLLVIIVAVALLAFMWRRDFLTMRLEGREFHNDLRATDPENPLSLLKRRQFMALYERAHRVRRPKYVLVYLALAATGTVPVLMLLAVLRRYLYLGPIFWGFEIFFALILWWVAALSIVLRFYYRRQPGTLDEELKRVNDQ